MNQICGKVAHRKQAEKFIARKARVAVVWSERMIAQERLADERGEK